MSLHEFLKPTSYSVSYEVVKMLQACLWIFLRSCSNRTIFDRLRKTTEVLACGLIWDISWMKKEASSFAWKEASVWLPSDDVTMDVDIRGKL